MRPDCHLYYSAFAHRIGREMSDKKKIYSESHPYLVIPARLFLKKEIPLTRLFSAREQVNILQIIRKEEHVVGMTGVWRRRKVGIIEYI